MSTLRISNIEAKSVPASATIDEKVKITNSSGDTLVFIDGKTSGITTVGINTTDSNITFDANSNVVVTGIITATKFSGQFEPTNLTVGGDLTIPDKIIHTGDTNTAIRFPAADTITFETSGTERTRIDSNGQLLVGTTSAGASVRAVFQGYNGGGENFQARVQFQTNQATNLTAQSHLANLLFTNASSSLGARIDVKADANWGTGSYPSRIEFGTTPSGANTPSERLRIDSNGLIIVGNSGTKFGNMQIQSFCAHGAYGSTSAFSAVDTTSVAEGVGGEIVFHGKYNTGAQDWAYYGHIKGAKENATAGNTACALKFFTRPNATAPSERLRIDSTGRVAINQPAGTGFTTGKVHIKSSASNIGQLYLEQNNATDGFMINQDGPNGGHLKFVRDIGGTQTTNVLFRSDRGICFNGDSAAANALDDYEEGSFTPFIRTANNTTEPSYTHRVGLYTKVGRLVTYAIRITTSGELSTGSGATQIHGLPFNAMNWNIGDWPGGAEIAYYSNLRGNYGTNPRLLGPYNNNTYIRFHLHNAQNDTGNNLYNHVFTNNTVMIIYGQYFAA